MERVSTQTARSGRNHTLSRSERQNENFEVNILPFDLVIWRLLTAPVWKQQHKRDFSGRHLVQDLLDPLDPLPLIRCYFGRYFEE